MRDTEEERSSFIKWKDKSQEYGHHYSFHLELDYISRVLSKKMNQTVKPFLGFEVNSIVNRFLQIIIPSIYSEFSNFYLKKSTAEKNYYRLNKDIINLSNYYIDLKKEEVKISNKFKMILFLKLCKNFIQIQFNFLYKVIFYKYNPGKASFFLENIPKFSFFDNNNDQPFLNFLKNFPIKEFDAIDYLYVQTPSNKIKSRSKKVKYSKLVVFEALNHLPKTKKNIFNFFFNHWINFFKIIFLALKNPLYLLIQRDLVYSALYETLRINNILKSIFYTNSIQFDISLNYSHQKNKNWQAIMLWYSAGCDYISFDKAPLDLFKVRMKFIRFDKTYVWSQRQAERLAEGIPKLNFLLCPPITYYMPDEQLINFKVPPKCILIFDEPPQSQTTIKKYYGYRYKYWDVFTAELFLKDIIDVFEKLNKKLDQPYTLIIKTKRNLRKGHHDMRYQNILNYAKSKGVQEVSLNCNLFELIKMSTFSIVSPFASPAHICAFMNKKCFYYDPKDEIRFIPKDHEKISFIKGKMQLNKLFSEELFF